MHPLPLEPLSHSPPPTPLGCHEHQAELPVSSINFPLGIYFTHGDVHVSMLLSQLSTPSLVTEPQFYSGHPCVIKRSHFPVYLAARCDHVTRFVAKWKLLCGTFWRALKWGSDTWHVPFYLFPPFFACIWNADLMGGAPATILEH